MKKARWIAILLLLVLLSGCSPKGCAIEVGGQQISENAYKRMVASLREAQLYSATEQETADYWKQAGQSGKSRSEELQQTAREALIEQALYDWKFEQLGLSLSSQEEQAVQEAVQEAVAGYGSMTAFQQALAQGNYTYDEFLNEYYAAARKGRVLGAIFADVGEDQLQSYYLANYAYVQFIYISKEDLETGELLQGEALEAARSKAQSALEAATRAGELDNFEALMGLYADIVPEEAKGTLVADNGRLDETFAKGALALKQGEAKIIETQAALMVTKRIDQRDAAVYTAAVRQQILEEMKAEALAEMLAEWRAEAGVALNKRVLKRWAPEKMMAN